jgi:carboxyl-terminal processing protease
MDTDRIPSGSTTDHEPTGATSLAPTPSPAPTSSATARGRRPARIGAVVVLALVATFGAGIGVGSLLSPQRDGTAATTPDPASSPGPSAPTEFALIEEAWDTLHREYVARDELDDRALIWAAIDGMTEAVGDTGHTDFMTPEERAARNDSLQGSYVGIGVRIDATEEGLPRVVAVFAGSPAEGAGIQADDVIVEVDGTATLDKTIDEVATLVRGEAGTTVSVTVRADGTGPERTYRIVRADVPIDPVSWSMVPGTTTALIRLEQFSSGAADQIVETLEAAREQGADRVVLDLRGNPGGYVNEAVGIASQFLSEGVVYIERNADGEEVPTEVSPEGVWRDRPVVVLVDGNTASSSEIVSGALQDAGRAQVVGETTFGTGTVLGEFVLSDGSALRVGTVEWLTPDGRRIWHEGIAPDVAVPLPDDVQPVVPTDVADMSAAEAAAIEDPQLARALEVVAAE